MSIYQVRQGKPMPCPQTMLHQEPCLIQTNLGSPSLTLEDKTGQRLRSRFLQQSNLQPWSGRRHLKAQSFSFQQSNLSLSKASLAECGDSTGPHLWLESQESFGLHTLPRGSPLCYSRQLTHLSQSQPPDPDFKLPADFSPLDGCPQLGPRASCVLNQWTCRPVGEPLTLDDLTVPAQSQCQAPSHDDGHQLLASMQCLEHKAAQLKCWGSQKPLDPVLWGPWASGGHAVPARPQSSRPAYARLDKTLRGPRSLREKTRGSQACLSSSQADSQPTASTITLGLLMGNPLHLEQEVLPGHPLSRRESCSPGPAYDGEQRGSHCLPRRVGNGEARLCSPTFSSASWGVPPGQEGGEGALKEQVNREASSCPLYTTPARSIQQNKAPNIVTLETETACWQLLSRCFRAWRKRWQTVVTAERMRRRQLLRRGLRVLRRALHLREARLQAAHARHRKALLARSFREWRELAAQQKPEQPRLQAVPGFLPSGRGWGQGPSGRKAAVEPTRHNSPGILKKKGGWPIPSHPGLRPDGRDERLQILEALQQLTIFLLWCHHKSLARQERGVRREVPSALPRIQKVGWCPQASRAPAAAPARVVPLKSQHQRDLLCKCLRTWQGFAQRESRCRDFLTDCRVRTLNTCLRQWVQMKKLHVSDGVKVTQLCLWRQKIESSALCSPAPRVSTAWGPRAVTKAQEQLLERSQGSLQKACRRLALHRALLLWRTQLSLHQQANVFLRSLKQRTLQYVLRQWHSSVPRPCTPSHSMKTTWALEPLSSNPTQEALMGCSSHRGSPEKAPRDPALLETLRVTFLRATGRRLQEHSLLLWQTRVQQAWDAVRSYQRALQSRWNHWTMARRTRRELAAHWAWARNCKAALGLWRRRLEQQRAEEQWAQVQGWRRKHNALHHWHSCWQRQQVLHEKYQAWTRVRLQGLGKAMLQGWQQATAHQRQRVTRPERLLLQSHFQAWQGFVRETRVLQTQCRVFWDNRTRRVLGAAFAAWWEALVAVVQTRKQFVAGAAISCWSKVRLHGRAHKRLRQTCTQQAYVAWRRAPGQHQEPRRQAEEKTQAWARVALCWMLWVYESHLLQVSQVHAAQKLSTRVLEAWAEAVAQARAHRVGFAQLQQAGPTPRLQTHWAQGQAPLRVQLETWAEAKEASTVRPRSEGDLKLCPMLSSREYLLFPVSTPAQWMQSPGLGLPRSEQHLHFIDQREPPGTPWAQDDPVQDLRWLPPCQPPLHRAVQLWLQWPVSCHWAQCLPLQTTPSRSPLGAGRHCSRSLQGSGEERQRLGTRNSQHWHLEALLGQLRDSQQAKCLAAAWQQWVDALREEQLAATLLRQWHLRWAWRLWRRRVLQLWVAQRFLRQEDSWILSQAFERWHQHLTARGWRSGASSSLGPPRRLGPPPPSPLLGAGGRHSEPAIRGLRAEQRPSCDLFP